MPMSRLSHLVATSATRWAAGLTLSALLVGCSAAPRASTENQATASIEALEARLLSNPDDAAVLRDLGGAYLLRGSYARGLDYLKQAFERDDDDPETLYLLGLANEALANPETALRLYARYATTPRASPFRLRLQGRYTLVQRQLAREAMQERLALEDSLRRAGIADSVASSPDVVAVYPLTYGGTTTRYRALGRGLGEMMSVDLAQVPGLRLIERSRLSDLLQEMELGRSGLIDPATAPRMGRIVGAGRVVTGTFDVASSRLEMDLAVAEVASGNVVNLDGQEGALQAMLELQKTAVFDVIAAFGIELTPVERERIQRVPTSNLEAFLAYSQGLERFDLGDYAGAADQLRRASTLDPGFEAAAADAETAEAAASTPPNVDDAIAEAADLKRRGEEVDLMVQRLNALSNTLYLHFVPSPQTRKPAVEASTELPLPPTPPTPSVNN